MGLGFKLLQHAAERTVSEMGSAVKLVACENCKGEYVYKLTREGRGKGNVGLTLNEDRAYQEANREAQAALQIQLDYDFDLVPCPFCGWYQQHMAARMRHEHRRWMLTSAWTLGPLGVLALLFTLGVTSAQWGKEPGAIAICWAANACCLALASWLFVTWRRGQQQFDPNAGDVEKRKELGRYRAMSKEDYLKMVQSPS